MLKACINSALLITLLAIQGCSPVQTKPAPVASGVMAARTSPGIEKTYRKIIRLMQQKQWKQAEAGLLSVIEQAPQNAGPWLNLGIARRNLGEQEAAESAFRSAISKNQDNPVGYNELGILYRHKGQFDKALEMYEQALKVAPDYPDSHWNIGILYEIYLSNTDLALQHYIRYRQLTGSEDPGLQGWISILTKENEKDGV